MALAILVAFGWLAFWVLVFVTRMFGEADTWVLIALLAGTSFGVGLISGRWWVLLLPLLVLPVFNVRSVYMPGAEPNYSIGLIVGAAFVLIAVPSIASGVGLSRR